MQTAEALGILSKVLEPRSYLQLGLDNPELLNQARCGSICVASSPRVAPGVHTGKPWLKLFDMARDEFFRTADQRSTLENEPLDLVVIDGEASSQIVRDLDHVATWAHPATIVIILSGDDDPQQLTRLAGTARIRWPELSIALIDAEPTPLLLIVGITPGPPGLAEIAATITSSPVPDGLSPEIPVVSLETAIESLGWRPVPIATRLDHGIWFPGAENRQRLELLALPHTDTLSPRIVLDPPIRHAFRVRLNLSLDGMEAIRLAFKSANEDDSVRERSVWLDAERPGTLEHELERVALEANPSFSFFELECESTLMPGEELREICLLAAGRNRQDISPEPGMAIELLGVAAEQIPPIRRVVRFVPERMATRQPSRRNDQRHAVIFAWYVPPEFPELGEYYRGLLRYHHADSKLFIGMNHGSDPRWDREIRGAGLDAEIRWARQGTDDYWDTTGFLTALAGYQRSNEPFSLVWFGHTKGASEPQSEIYRDQRHQHHREFWARRDDIEREFQNPVYGLFAPRFNLTPPYPWPVRTVGWNGELDALRRVYREEFEPLGLCAYETVYVLRDAIVRNFCDAVGEAFFRIDPGEIGASKWFFEMAFPSIASMQGFEPYIEMNVTGANDPRDDVTLFADAKQNHRLAQEEVARWRRDPYRFEPRVIPWDHSAWDGIRALATAGSGSAA